MRRSPDDKVILISGSTSGLGRELALLSASEFTHVILLGRNTDALQGLKRQIQLSDSCQVFLYEADYISGLSVSNVAEKICNAFDKIDVVIHNVGALYSQGQILKNGIDRMYQINYLSHYILTETLIAKGCKLNQIIFVGSSIKNGDLDFLDSDNIPYSIRSAYAGSKLALKLYAKSLSENHPGLLVNCFQPGRLNTDIGVKSTHFAHRMYWKIMSVFAGDVQHYASLMLDFICQNNNQQLSGFSYENGRWMDLNRVSVPATQIQKLMQWSADKNHS